jgi:hypothetical protein
VSFDLADYKDVAERIAEFKAKFPEGSLQSELRFENDGWLCRAYAYRTPEDERPGIGHAFEPVPGKTPYTKDSEAMNAETSAWGRAIVALGFETKKIASRQEIQSRSSEGEGSRGRRPSRSQDATPEPSGNAGSAFPSDDLATPEEIAAVRQAGVTKRLGMDLFDREVAAGNATVEWLQVQRKAIEATPRSEFEPPPGVQRELVS